MSWKGQSDTQAAELGGKHVAEWQKFW